MSSRTLSSSAVVFSEQGPVLAEGLTGRVRLICLNGSGRFEMVEGSATTVASGGCVRLLTEAGDVSVPENEFVITASGPIRASEIRSGLRKGTATKVERYRPSDVRSLSGFASARATKKQRSLASISALNTAYVRLPRSAENPTFSKVEHALEGLTSIEFFETDRWFVWRWPKGSTNGCIGGWSNSSLDQLLTLTLWSDNSSKCTLPKIGFRQHLMIAAIQEDRQLKFSWTPGYAPVETRIEAMDSRDAYARVTGSADETADLVKLTLDRPGAVIAWPLAVGKLT